MTDGDSGFRIVVAGDPGTGKSTLISTAATGAIPSNTPPVLPPTRLPQDIFRYNVPVTAIDTSSSLEDRDKVADELKRADAVVLTFACDPTFERLTTFWLPYLQRLEVKAPVIVAGCKLDLRKGFLFKKVMLPIMRQFPQIDRYLECSIDEAIEIIVVFLYAQKAVLHPRAPLFDWETETLKPRCLRALMRICILTDQDGDGALNDQEFNNLMVIPRSMALMNSIVRGTFPEGVKENRLTFQGFIYAISNNTEIGYPELTWEILRKFNYNNDIRLCYDRVLYPIKRTPDQSVELTSEAMEFLKRVFSLFDIDGERAFCKLEYIFPAVPESLWSEAPFTEIKPNGGLSLNGFLSKWALMTLLNPVLSIENLKEIGYASDPSSAVKVTRRRRVDRNVFHCFVFGPKEAGKSSLMHAFVGRPFSEVYTPTIKELYTVNIVDQPGETRKTLILREIPEDAIGKLLIHKDALAACDIAVFVYDSSNESSWTKATELLVQVASYAKSTGYEVPCLIIAAKDDLKHDPTAKRVSTRVSQDMGIEAPIPISTKLGDLNDVYMRIVKAAEHSETKAGKTRKRYYRLLVSVGVVVAIMWLVLIYGISKN